MTPHRESCLVRRMRRGKRIADVPEAAAPAFNRKQRRALASAQLARAEDASGKAQAKPGKVMRDGTVMIRVGHRMGKTMQAMIEAAGGGDIGDRLITDEGWIDLDGHPVRVRGQGG